MNWGNTASVPVATARQWFRLDTGAFIVATFIIVLGFFLLYPVALIARRYGITLGVRHI